MKSKEESPESLAAVADRLRLIREATGLNKAAWSRLVGITPQAWNNVEGSKNLPAANRISLDQALLVCRATGVSLDFIYRGEMIDRLPSKLLSAIQEIQRETKRKRA